MSPELLALIALGRAVVVAVVVVALAPLVGRAVVAWRAGMVAALLVVVTPALVPGHIWATAGFSPLHQGGAAAEAWYGLLLLARGLAVAALLWPLMPVSPLAGSPAAAARLMLPRDDGRRWRWPLAAWLRPNLAVACVVAVLTAADFELASLTWRPAWTVALHDAQVQGADLGDALRRVAWPLVIQALLLTPLWWCWRGAVARRAEALRPWSAGSGAVLLLVALTLLVLVPLGRLLVEALGTGGGDPMALLPEMGHGALAASLATALAMGLAALAGSLPGRARALADVLLVVPGLCGGLVIGLAGLSVGLLLPEALQRSLLPWCLGLALVVLPVVVALRRLLVERSVCAPGQLAAVWWARPRLAARLAWRLRIRPWALVAGLAFCLAALDLAASDLLAPAGRQPAVAVLYNMMHYQQAAALASMTLVVIVLPVLALLVLWLLVALALFALPALRKARP